MKKMLLMVLLCSAVISVMPLQAQDNAGFKIIVNKSNPVDELSSDLVSKMFLRKEIWWPDTTKMFVAPIELPDSLETRQVFSNNIHQQSVDAVKKFWRVMILSGKDVPPDVLPADTSVVRYVSQTTGGIGYVSSEADLTDEVKELKIIYNQIVKNEESE